MQRQYAMQHSEHVGQHDGDAAWKGAIGAAEQIVHNNNNKLITQQGESQTKLKKFKKVLKKFYKNWNSFKNSF